MYWLLYLFLFCIGAAIGSFLNVVIDRLPQKKSIIAPPSSCDSCRRQLKALDLIPIISYLWLRGKCRYCDARVPLRVLIVEIVTALSFVLLLWRFSLSWACAVGLVYTCIFIVLSVIDLERLELPDVIIYPAMPVALVCFILLGDRIPGLYFNWQLTSHSLSALLSSLCGGAIGFVFLLLVALLASKFFKKEAMGGGDIKLAALIGLMLGFPLILVSLYVSIIVGAVVSVIIVLLRKRGWKDAVPFGPFLCLGALVTLLWGGDMLQWYIVSLMR